MSGEEWKGESTDDGRVKFGRKARLWLDRLIRAKLSSLAGDFKSPTRFDLQDIDGMMWYLFTEDDDPIELEYVVWADAEEYRGSEFSNGAWCVNWPAILKYLPRAVFVGERKRLRDSDNARITSLDQWLEEDIAGTLAYPGREGGSKDLPDELRSTLANAARKREKRRPIECTDCGGRFISDRRNAKRCATCREKIKGAGATAKARR